MLFSSFVIATILPLLAKGQVVGKAFGFATGTTGGGNAVPAAPSDIAQLQSWLADSTPRVILISKTFDFTTSQGSSTETGCIPSSDTCGSAGQLAINRANYCASFPATSVSFYNAAMTPLVVASNKSIVGVGSAGIIKGKGLRIQGATNVIVQNIWITNLNPQYIWGGDAITLQDCDKVWIDHCKFSLIGRQMIVSGFDAAGHVTISNNEFDGTTSWSASCNQHHYWTILLLGAADWYTFSGNYVHTVSGRAPKLGYTGAKIYMHAVNNYFYNVAGHAFDVEVGVELLVEGNAFNSVTTPFLSSSSSSGAQIFDVPSSSYTSTCSSYIGRTCQVNSIASSGTFTSFTNTGALSALSGLKSYLIAANPASGVAASVVANAGIGKLSQVATTTTKATTTAATTTKATTTTTKATTTGSSSGACATLYGQCGGIGFTGPT
ncbi:hypothetical protein TWF694_011560 [Orbilia ellipsospora]|uniref:pectin lyase n=1 Tax=Orbilia ellipsospora TaxID=2528407 RepID=A0AAV9X5K8_9PEZI